LSRPAGIGLLTACVLLLLAGLKFASGGDHPLALSNGFDLCGRVATAWGTLPGARGEPQARIPGFGEQGAASCYLPLAEARTGERAQRYVWTIVMTHRMLATDGVRPSTGKYVETFLAETRASGAQVDDVKGPWRSAGVITARGTDPELQLLAHDDGVVLWVGSRGLDAKALSDFAALAARRLREKK